MLAFVALHRQAVGRLLVAGTLWSEVSDGRSYASLRSALARLDRASRKTLQVTPLSLELAQGVAVDLRDARALAHRLLEPIPPAEADLSAAAIASLSLGPALGAHRAAIQHAMMRALLTRRHPVPGAHRDHHRLDLLEGVIRDLVELIRDRHGPQ